MSVTNDREHAAAIDRMIYLERQPEPTNNAELIALGETVEAYEEAAGHTPNPPSTLRGILEVEMFKRRIRQRGLAQLLEIPESRLSELMKGKREMNLDIARRLFTKLAIPAEVVLTLAA